MHFFSLTNYSIFTIIFTVISQMPILLPYNRLLKIPMLSLWVILILLNILKNGIRKRRIFLNSVILMILYYSYILILSFYNENYMNNNLFNVISISYLFFIAGYTLYVKEYASFLKKISFYYIISVFFITFNIYISYFWKVELNNSGIYMYSSKNSAGVLIVFSIALIMYRLRFKCKVLSKIIYIFLLIENIYILMLLQNRAGIIAILILILIDSKKLFSKKYIITIIILIITIIFYIDNIMEFLFWSLKIGKADDLNDFSSGRLDLIKNAIDIWKENMFLGVGKYYIDNFYVNVLVSNGIIGFFIIFSMLINYFSIIKHKIVRNSILYKFILIVIIISFFEALPPFGPGSIYAIFWFVFGVILNKGDTYEDITS